MKCKLNELLLFFCLFFKSNEEDLHFYSCFGSAKTPKEGARNDLHTEKPRCMFWEVKQVKTAANLLRFIRKLLKTERYIWINTVTRECL